ncbi:MAG: asparagine synthase-related protein [Chloroflexota bacterium]
MTSNELSAVGLKTLVQELEESVKRHLAEGLLLSGGLDTAILAYLAVKWVKPYCITVALKGAPAPDIEYARLVARRLGLKHYVHYFGEEELEEGIGAVVRVRQTFDPMEVRNSAAIYVALKVAKEQGISTAMTGDGGDELFGGYSFLFGLTREQLEEALKKMWANMSFSSRYLAKELGMEARLPFLDPEFKTFAQGLDAGLKVRSEGGQVWGKWLLRKAFEPSLPAELLWRVKVPAEVGTGTTTLPSLFDSRIPDREFQEKREGYRTEDRVSLRSKEHLHYYEIYRSLVGVPYVLAGDGKACPDCGSDVEERTSFCRTCGAYPI